ncbi:MAG: peptidylprolyl isomerase [Steroidobacteraceae bacterium]|jgi:peptidylprolyl isomerase
MMRHIKFLGVCALSFLARHAMAAAHPTMADILAASRPEDWRPVNPDDTLYVDLAAGRVIIEMAPRFAPIHVAAIQTLAHSHYYDHLSIVRVQDNYVVQWGDPENRHPVPEGMRKVAPEFDTAIWPHMPFTRLQDGDVYAPEVGFSDGFPAARSSKLGLTWLAHCYGMVGVGRDVDVESGSGAELYVVIGHAPRHLDRNVALVGRVLQGAELLSELPRGAAELGFYSNSERPTRIETIRVASDVPAAQRTALEVMRTDTPAFAALIEARRNRPEEFFKVPAGHIDLCNVPIPVRVRKSPPSP